MNITFWGAARQVTGSMHILKLDSGFTILVDCGVDMEHNRPEDKSEKWGPFPFDPVSIDLVVLTHAHLDHSGMLPNLYLNGFEGQILCTKPTSLLTEIILFDSADINVRKLENYNKLKKLAPNKVKYKPSGIFFEKHVSETLQNIVTIPFNSSFEITNEVSLTFIPTGHLLGAANAIFTVNENGKKKTIAFSGDVGRKNYPLLTDPQKLPEVDYLVCESTYGSRNHTATDTAEQILEDIIVKTCVEIRGRLIIPAFSVGRTQAVLFVLNKIFKKKGMKPIKIFADSPMALQSTYAYEKFDDLLNQEAKDFKQQYGNLFDQDNLIYVENFKQSRQIANYHEPCIILSSSGMLTGGRINFHLQKNISNPYCTILMIGYAAENTPGHELLQRKSNINLAGKLMKVQANIVSTDILSGHAGQNDLIEFVKSQNPKTLKQIFLVHGNLESMEGFASKLNAEGFEKVEIPQKGVTYQLD